MIDPMCQKKWFVKFDAGDFFLDKAPQSGRPVEVDSNQVKTLIENNQHCITQEIATIFKIFKSIKLLVKLKSVSFMEKTKQIFWPTQYIHTTPRWGKLRSLASKHRL